MLTCSSSIHLPSSFPTTICTQSQVLCPLYGVNQHSTWQTQAPVHQSPVATPIATGNKVICFMVYIRNSACQPVQTKATTQKTPPYLAVLINADHLHNEKSELHTNYVTGLESKQKPSEAQRATRSAFYLASLLTLVCLCNISLHKCTCWQEQGLATGWTVRGSYPGGSEIYRTCPGWPCGPPSPLYNGHRAPSRG
jgi:hypothetical protein